jgi:hypothetical protein
MEVGEPSSFGYSYVEWNSSPQRGTFFLSKPLGSGPGFCLEAESTLLDGLEEGNYGFGYLGPQHKFFPPSSQGWEETPPEYVSTFLGGYGTLYMGLLRSLPTEDLFGDDFSGVFSSY